jgi:arginine/lysine/histidine/glutamine transport system ATP-binding protein
MNRSVSSPALVFENVEKHFGAQKVLQGISGHVNTGEVMAIIGPSGCGKSTLLRCFNRLEMITAGHIWVNGIDLTKPRIDLIELRSQVSMVFQQFNLFPHMNVLENLSVAPRHVLHRSRREANELASFYLEKVGLVDKAYARPNQLSGGEKQRVAIARSLCMQPKIILFDEPTSSLDPELVGEVLEVMQNLAIEGMTMVVVTHEILFARDVANRVMFLDRGKIVEEGPAHQVMTHPNSERLTTFLKRIDFVPKAGIA